MKDPFEKEPKPEPTTFQPEYNQDCAVDIAAGQWVKIRKMFGPLIFADIRVRADFDTCEWIVERQSIKDGETWSEVARIPGQMEGEFEE